MQQTAHKAIAAALMSLMSLTALFVPGVEAFVQPELVQALAALAAPFAVYWIPNRSIK